jgi:hypothetical protein
MLNSAGCSDCGIGVYSSASGMSSKTSCISCGAGAYSTISRSQACMLCSAGSYHTGLGASSASDCKLCPADTYNPTSGSQSPSECTPCPNKTTTQGKVGQTHHSDCSCLPEFYQVTLNNVVACQSCPIGAFFSDDSSGLMWCSNYLRDDWLSCDSGYRKKLIGNWTLRTEDKVYVLRSCQQGYYVSNGTFGAFNQSIQQCIACPEGAECISQACVECSACPSGTYKDSKGTGSCQNCFTDTYNSKTGSVLRSDCKQCPCLSTTEGRDRQSSVSSCICSDQYYRVANNNNARCQACARGALCTDGTCALRNRDTLHCNQTDEKVKGTWTFDALGEGILVSCPPGHSTMTKEKSGSVDLQECKPCVPGQYILFPDTDGCQKCPKGLFTPLF